jgi:hypothetical protein
MDTTTQKKQQIRNRIKKSAAKTQSGAKTVRGQHTAIMRYYSEHPFQSRGARARWWERTTLQNDYIAMRTERATKIVQLGTQDARDLDQQQRSANRRRQNWEAPRAVKNGYARTEEINNGQYSSRCTYTHWSYRPIVGSSALAQGRKLQFTYSGETRHITAPRGWAWRYDTNGVYIYLISNHKISYHPDSDDLNRTTPAQIAKKCRELYCERRAQERKNRAEAAQIQRLIAYAKKTRCMVRLQDSIAAGNCAAGTRAWAARHGLVGEYAPIERIAQTRDDSPNGKRLVLALVAAARRHEGEMRRGYCEL